MTEFISVELLESISAMTESASYKVDILRIFGDDLQHVKLNSLCPKDS